MPCRHLKCVIVCAPSHPARARARARTGGCMRCGGSTSYVASIVVCFDDGMAGEASTITLRKVCAFLVDTSSVSLCAPPLPACARARARTFGCGRCGGSTSHVASVVVCFHDGMVGEASTITWCKVCACLVDTTSVSLCAHAQCIHSLRCCEHLVHILVLDT